MIEGTLVAAEAIVAKEQLAGSLSDLAFIQSSIRNIEGALKMVYPAGFSNDPIVDILSNTEDLSGTAAEKDFFAKGSMSLWWANKELAPTKPLSDYTGKNEKTKIIVKMTRKGSSAPMKEQPISQQEQKNMMAYYYKKQEQQKKLEADAEDGYLESSWADSKSLKKCFTGVGDVKFRPF